ncbi:glycosyltransferase family 4 protein [Tenuifilum thalassicum]|uniref:Glycosyltransferase family 4 protein n=1 Tax=Tenuifilum thalassicum TaxID=2590900 RepID=A0A7D3XLS4_9BACT|nr:glycosyltransferase family 4 protein [Tenuifilum thalassicum]QKG80570.1 glycosyltransferase family 4 protein [Tenuifilum thalassicum]
MNILVISHKPPYPPVDGGTLATLNMCIGLAKAGNRVTVLTLSSQKHPSSLDIIPDHIQNLINFEIVHTTIKTNIPGYIRNFLFSKRPYNIERYISLSFKRLLIKNLKNQDYQVVQIEGLYLYPYLKTIRRHFKGLISIRTHNVEHQIWDKIEKNENSKPRQLYFKFLAKRLARIEHKLSKMVDALVSITEPDRQWFINNGFTKPSITIPVGYFTDDITSDADPVDFPSICYIGALDWLPNIEGLKWFLDWVWPIIQAEIPGIEFHIAGRNAPEDFAERLMIERNIIFHGQVASASAFLSRCPIMIVPLLSGSGLRIKIIEGMHLNRTIIATSIAVKGIDVKHKEHLLIADKPEEFAHAVCSVINDPSFGKQLGKNALEYAKSNFDAVKLAHELTNFYEKILQ